MKGEKVVFSRDSNLWQTPADLFAVLDAEFCFTTDVAASKDNALCKRFITEEQDALVTPWTGVCWCNPPYNRVKDFVYRAACMANADITSVLLIPARTDTRYWHGLVKLADEVRFLKGRLKFVSPHGKPLNSAPFPSAVVIFRPTPRGVMARATNYCTWDYRECK